MNPQALLARILWLAGAACVLVLAFFFFLAAVVAGALLVGGLLVRIWWVRRKMKKAAEAQFVSAEYRVVERERIVEPQLPDNSGTQRPEEK
jgi:hypothetical protein